MIRTIFLPTDSSLRTKKAVDFACTIAAKFQARIPLLHVLPEGATVAKLRNLVNAKRLPKEAREMMERFDRFQTGATNTRGIAVSIPIPDEVFETPSNAVLSIAPMPG